MIISLELGGAGGAVAKHDKYARLDSKRHQSGPEAAVRECRFPH